MPATSTIPDAALSVYEVSVLPVSQGAGAVQR